jgi:aryl-alcohol dehydrogenase-like predicted oxidoreductase
VGNRELETGEWVKDFSPQWIRTGIEGSLKRLKTEVIDVYHLHSPRTDFEYGEKITDLVEKVNRLSFLNQDGGRTLAQAALQFCLARPVVSTVIAGARRPAQVVANAQASDLPPLSNGELAEIHSAV